MIDEIENYSDFKTKQQIKSYIKKYGFDKYIELFKEDDSGFCPSALRLDDLNNISREDICESCCGYEGYEEEDLTRIKKFMECHKNFLIKQKLMFAKKTNREGYIK